MPQQTFPVNATKIEFVCDCGKGVYRLSRDPPEINTTIYQWRHNCTSCKREAYFTVPYPIIETNSEEVARGFIMRDSMPPPRL